MKFDRFMDYALMGAYAVGVLMVITVIGVLIEGGFF